MVERKDVVVIGAGQAGLCMSYYLTLQGREHVVLEKARVGETWRSRRWDSFTLVTPNWRVRLPGFPYRGDRPDDFMTKDEIVSFLESFAKSFGARIRSGTLVQSLERREAHDYLIRTEQGAIEARCVVVATGAFQVPKIPLFRSQISLDVLQIHSEEYRNPTRLPPGAILVVGAGQSGAQIAEELNEAGRKVYLATSGAGRIPRRYRGKDYFYWVSRLGMDDDTVDRLPSPQVKFESSPHVTGKRGGHDLSLRDLERKGVVLLGSARSAEDTRVRFAPNLGENLVKEDEYAFRMIHRIDQLILQEHLDAPVEDVPSQVEAQDQAREPVLELDLNAAGVSTIIWANGCSTTMWSTARPCRCSCSC